MTTNVNFAVVAIFFLVSSAVNFQSHQFLFYLDSGSMNTPLGKSRLFSLSEENRSLSQKVSGDIPGPLDHVPTRWDELRQTVSIVTDLASM